MKTRRPRDLEKIAEWVYRETSKCMYCGFCEPVCPTLIHGVHRGYGPRGRILVAKTMVEERRATSEALASIYSCLACRACTLKCVVELPVAEIVLAVRYLYSKEFFGKPDYKTQIRTRQT